MTRDHDPVPSITDPRTDALIDAALRRVSSAAPASDLQGRILNRLAAERCSREAAPVESGFLPRLHRITRASAPIVCGLSACLVAAVIVAGSVSHSRRMHTNPVLAPPVLALPAHGLGAASAVHPAAPASTPAPVGQNSRGRSAQKSRGRARIAPHAHKAAGIAVPVPDSRN
jgi:hypothetical protein